jgi:diguanylate cyclase (GGDEF)-like protein
MLGRRFVIDAGPLKIGRDGENHVVLPGDSVSRRHAAVELKGDEAWIRDNGSTNGTFINDAAIKTPHRLRNGDRVKIGPTILKYLAGDDVEAKYHEEIYRMTIIDGLTGLHVKRYMLEALEKEAVRATRSARPLSVVMIDIDHFKKVNDVHGHLAGDAVLRDVAHELSQRLRQSEVLARYGGEEFALVLPETALEGARAVAEEMRRRVEGVRVHFQGETIAVTASFGIAEFKEHEAPLALLGRADAQLYAAKRGGRNCVRGA